MQALVSIYILGKLLSYGPRPQIFFNQGIGRDICVATKWGRIHGYARAPKWTWFSSVSLCGSEIRLNSELPSSRLGGKAGHLKAPN